MFHALEITSFSASAGWPFLKDRILRLWNPIVSSARAAIVTQSPRGEEIRGVAR
jgi:hypothetical protein